MAPDGASVAGSVVAVTSGGEEAVAGPGLGAAECVSAGGVEDDLSGDTAPAVAGVAGVAVWPHDASNIAHEPAIATRTSWPKGPSFMACCSTVVGPYGFGALQVRQGSPVRDAHAGGSASPFGDSSKPL